MPTSAEPVANALGQWLWKLKASDPGAMKSKIAENGLEKPKKSYTTMLGHVDDLSDITERRLRLRRRYVNIVNSFNE